MPKIVTVIDFVSDRDITTEDVREAIRDVWMDFELGNDWYYFTVPSDWWIPREEWPEGMEDDDVPEYETVLIDWLKGLGYTKDDNILLHFWW